VSAGAARALAPRPADRRLPDAEPTSGSRAVFRRLTREGAPRPPTYAEFDEARLPPPRPRPGLTPAEDQAERERRERAEREVVEAVERARKAYAVAEAPKSPCAEALERLRPVVAALRANDAARALDLMRLAAEPIGGKRREHGR